MQTNFTEAQLADPRTAEANRIIRSCVHCGFCLATCPTYVELGNELDSPRGRIYLIKEMLEKDRPASKEIVTHIDRCLSCLACVTTCPSGVDYMHLIDQGRARIEETYRRPWPDRLMRTALGAILPYPGGFRAALAAGLFARPLAPILRGIGGPFRRLAAMLELTPSRFAERSPARPGMVFSPQGERRGRVALLTGCAQPVLAPSINEATIRLLNRMGIEVVLAAGEGCCGAIVHHMGQAEPALGFARANIDAWMREIEGEGLDAIIITASGCGTTIKDYGHMLQHDTEYRERAAKVAGLARDLTEYLHEVGLPEPVNPTGLTVAYHSACSMQHGQRVTFQPKLLLERAGFGVRDVPEGHLCCGSAGTYNILQPEIATRLRDRKVANIARVAPDVIATGNIGCMAQIAAGTDIPVVHTAELIDWATGGPAPEAIAGTPELGRLPQAAE